MDNLYLSMLKQIENDQILINSHNEWGYSALHGAVINHDIQSINKILSIEGVNVDNKDKFGHTPLLYASYRPKINIIRILINAGSDPNVKIMDGHTLLHVVAEMDRMDIMEEFILAGVNIPDEEIQQYIDDNRTLE